jgi:Choline dehydrogenase and related flavoproteins
MGVSGAQYDLFPNDFRKAAERFRISSDLIARACEPFQLHYSVFTREPRMREKYREELSTRENLTVALECPAQKLIGTPEGWISGVEILTEEGPLTIRAENTILACGCIENTRFLMLQRDFYKLPCLPELPVLGQFLQDHPGAHLGEISFNKGVFLQDLFRLKDRNGIAYKARISWCESVRREGERPAVSGTLLMIPGGSEYDDARHNGLGQLLMKATRPDLWLKMISSASRGSIFSPLHRTYLAVSAEDVRDDTSRIRLSKHRTDAQGKPLAEIAWKVSPVVADSILSYLDAFERFLGICNLGKLRRFSFAKHRDDLLARLQDNSHQIGTTSMADSPSGGVVDRNLRVFGTKNLYITGTSVLPTGSHANPTLTALALGFRLSRHLTEGR